MFLIAAVWRSSLLPLAISITSMGTSEAGRSTYDSLAPGAARPIVVSVLSMLCAKENLFISACVTSSRLPSGDGIDTNDDTFRLGTGMR